jgi:hypothetical protein
VSELPEWTGARVIDFDLPERPNVDPKPEPVPVDTRMGPMEVMRRSQTVTDFRTQVETMTFWGGLRSQATAWDPRWQRVNSSGPLNTRPSLRYSYDC